MEEQKPAAEAAAVAGAPVAAQQGYTGAEPEIVRFRSGRERRLLAGSAG